MNPSTMDVGQRIAEVVAEPRAHVPVVIVAVGAAAVLLVLLALLAVSVSRRGRGSGRETVRDSEGRRYLIVESTVLAVRERRRVYALLSGLCFGAAVGTALWIALAG